MNEHHDHVEFLDDSYFPNGKPFRPYSSVVISWIFWTIILIYATSIWGFIQDLAQQGLR